MKHSIRSIAFVALLAATAATGSLLAADPVSQQDPTKVSLPKALVGVVTESEFQGYVAFQNKLQADPEIKAVNDKIAADVKDLQELQAKAATLRAAFLATDPNQKVVGDKIMKAMMAPPPAKK